MTKIKILRKFNLRAKQRGISLYVIIVLVLLSMLLALWASRTSLFNELLVGNEADYRRAYEAAQAMLQDAELDIRGVNPDGTPCIKDVSNNPDFCRPELGTTLVYFDFETKDLEKIFSQLDAAPTKCLKGICQKRQGAQDFWNNSATLAAMTAPNVGARFGQFTGAKVPASDVGGSAILKSFPEPADPTKRQGAWYWVEILPYADPNVSLLAGLPPGSNVEVFAPSRKRPWVYRITAIARGLRPGTEVVLQSTLSLKTIE